MTITLPKAATLGAIGLFVLAASATTLNAQDSSVLATVNGQEITQADLENAYRSLPPQYQQVPLGQIQSQLLDQMIDQQLLLELARERGLQDDDEVQSAMARAQDDVLRQAVLEDEVMKATSDDALQSAFEERKASIEPEDEVHARHILVENEEDARAIIEELDGGADFETLAKEKSTGPSGPSGGDLGYFKKGAMVPEFAEAAFSMEPGEYSSEPVQTQFGWHIIRGEDKRAAEIAFEEVAPELREELARDAVTQLLEETRANAEIVRSDETATE